MDKISIAIDGPAAAGKSTIAKMVANNLNYTYIDTGAMYRCVAYYAFIHQVDFHDEAGVCNLLKDIKINMLPGGIIMLNNQDVSMAIRENEVSMGASIVSGYSRVRSFLVSQQRDMAKGGGVILDGRDIGTVVLPNADLKIFLTASAEARAERRVKQLKEKGIEEDYNTVLAEIRYRDEQDTNRMTAPLKKAEDAVLLDTTELDFDQS